jgi:GNAT superfamily N-acetyltransferase
VLLDHPNGRTRFTYAQIRARKVEAIAIFVLAEPLEGLPCFQSGYAVVEPVRRQGVGGRVLRQAIEELAHGLGRTPMKEFYVEAIAGTENEASNKLARRLISNAPTACDDCFSNEPAFQYPRKVRSGA